MGGSYFLGQLQLHSDKADGNYDLGEFLIAHVGAIEALVKAAQATYTASTTKISAKNVPELMGELADNIDAINRALAALDAAGKGADK